MGPEAILLEVMRGAREGTYRFTCPTCMDAVEKRADRKIVALLVSAGVDVSGRGGTGTESLFDQEEPFDPTSSEAPAFTMDDLIEFHFRLEDDSYIRDFLSRR
jgi:hypothetical protein